jgi:hypothetical protein
MTRVSVWVASLGIGVFWADDMFMSWVTVWPMACVGSVLLHPGDGDVGGDGELLFWFLMVGQVLMDVSWFFPYCDMKMDGEGALLMMLVPCVPSLEFIGVGGLGAVLPDSSSEGSPATWAPVAG